ncbi:glycosyltransferase [Sporosarcina sp. 179-K 3D1 HS]|uniref:glycosyltransferase n=1 Tax=Sporosarcina sp. 179-K 3D1 HS TaxID=3232169 RepID=UPI00399F4E88
MVSINCITYNHEDYIQDALEGFLMQRTDFDFEILVGEDCSTDGTRQIVEKYVQQYPEKIKMITSKQNVGGRENAIRLQEASKGRYIAICEGDDYWTDPYKLQKQVDYMESHPDCTFCFHNAIIVNGKRKRWKMLHKKLIKTSNYYNRGAGMYTAGELAMLDFIPTASYLFRKELLDNPPDWYMTAIVGDVPVKLIAASHGYAYYMDEIMSVYRTGVKGSVTYIWRKESGNKQRQQIINSGFLVMFDAFNDYSNGLFEQDLDTAKIQFEVELLRLDNEREKLKSPRYKEYFRRLGWIGRMKYFAKLYFPRGYILFTRIKAYI